MVEEEGEEVLIVDALVDERAEVAMDEMDAFVMDEMDELMDANGFSESAMC